MNKTATTTRSSRRPAMQAQRDALARRAGYDSPAAMLWLNREGDGPIVHQASTQTEAAGVDADSPPRASAAPAGELDATAELRAVINAMPEAVFVCDADDRIRLVNPAGNALFEHHPIRDREDFLSRFVTVKPDGASGEPVTLRRDAANRRYELRSFPLNRGEAAAGGSTSRRTGTLLVLRDVTADHEERGERHAFLSILSHELRTPITTIYAGSRVLARREAAAAPTPASREIAADISAEAARLYDVVEDLLVLTRAEQGLLELADEAVLLPRAVEAAVRIAHARSADVPVVIDGLPDPPAVSGDPYYIEQVVRNLVTAAARFGSAASPVIVRLDARGDEVAATVLDRGPDVTTEDVRTSFSLNEAPSSERRWGLGIGLFVCRRLIEAMDGRIWVRPRDGGGAEFGFALRRYAEPD
jgi:signal transduction histidine kinase